MRKNITRKNVYKFLPTSTGLKYCSQNPSDPERSFCCALYPDCDKSNVYNDEELSKLERYPFRPVLFALLAPGYRLDLHTASGLSGYGRFAIVKDELNIWLDEFDEIEAELINGELHYCVKTAQLPGIEIRLNLIPTAGAAGMVGYIDCSTLDDHLKIYYIHGGALGWNTHSEYNIAYTKDCCFNNIVTLKQNTAAIYLDNGTYDFEYPGLKEVPYQKKWSAHGSTWLHIKDWVRKIYVRTDCGKQFIADPSALKSFNESLLSEYRCAKGGLVCTRFTNGRENYFAVGIGQKLAEGNLKELYDTSHMANMQVAERLYVSSGVPEFDGSVRLAAGSTQGIFGDNVFMTGSVSWREGYLGWRNTYGPMAYGMIDQVYRHFDTHFRNSLITIGPDKGGIMDMLELTRPGKEMHMTYNMVETFIDQAKHYWEYTGDSAFAKRVFPIVEGCIAREIRRLKPSEEWLFENSLNTWISDSHWTLFGQCTQASAYMYNMFRFASDLADTL